MSTISLRSRERHLSMITLALLMLLILPACGEPGKPVFSITLPIITDTATSTPSLTPTATPLKCPTVTLPPIPLEAPPEETTLFIVLFDPADIDLLYLSPTSSGMSLEPALSSILHAWVGEGDRVVFFQLGCRYHSPDCRLVNALLPTPLPRGPLAPPSPTYIPTLTPLPTPDSGTNRSLFSLTAEARHMTQTATYIAPTQTAIYVINGCAVKEWESQHLGTWEAYQATQTAIARQIEESVNQYITQMPPGDRRPTPYTPNVLLDGLYHASNFLTNERGNYDKYIILIFDKLEDWRVDLETGEVHDLSFSIDLEGADAFLFAPDCEEEYFPPVCKTKYRIWQEILKTRFKARNVYPIPNSRIMERLQPFLSEEKK